MKLEQQITSLEISKKLKELGVEQESLFYWRLVYHISESFSNGVSTGKKGIIGFDEYHIEYYPKPRFTTGDVKWNERDLAILDDSEISAFTVAELGELLHEHCCIEDEDKGRDALPQPETTDMDDRTWETRLYYKDEDEDYVTIEATTEADARGKMLIYLLENKLITL